MKKLLTFLTLLTLFFMTAGAETVTYSLTPDNASTGLDDEAYIKVLTEFTYSDVSWKMKYWNPNSLQVRTNQSKAGDEFRFYNTSAFPGRITQVVITFSTLTVSDASKLMFIGGSSEVSEPTGGTAGTWDSNAKTLTWTPGASDNFTFFGFYQNGKAASGNNYLAESDAIVVTYEEGSTPVTTYNVNLNQTTGGTISASTTTAAEGATVTLTATPDAGYKLGSVTVTPSETGVDAPTATINGNTATFTMPASDVTVNATFTELPTYGITVIGGTASPTTAYQGRTVTVTPTIPDGKVIDQITTTPELTLTPSGDKYTFTMPNEAVTVTITYKDAPTYTNKFERITSTDKLETGVRYLLVYETTPAVMGAISTTSTKYGTSVTSGFTLSNGVITLASTTDAKPLTLGGTTGAWTFDLDGNTLAWTSGNSLITGNNQNTWSISFSGNDVVISNAANNDRQIGYNPTSGQNRFATYDWPNLASNTTIVHPQLYKEVTQQEEVSDLYLIGRYMNSQTGDTQDGWELTDGPQFTYSNTAGTYAVNAYFDLAERGYFQFVEGLSTDGAWGTLTGRYYASSNDSDVPVDSYNGNPLPMDGEHGLYFTNSIQYSPGEYAFTIPAGLYTIVVDKPNWQIYVTQHPVTMNITGSAYFNESTAATLSSNLTEYEGAKIYYTTDGTTPDENSTEYSGEPLTISETTTVKAIAILNFIKSDVVTKIFTKKPAKPIFNPEGGFIYEPTQVSITCSTPNAVIYYTLDGSTPSNVDDEANTSAIYESPITVGETTTIKARAYVGDNYSDVAVATYTLTQHVEPGENDFVLVTNKNQLIAGNEYIIVNRVNKMALGTYQKTANRDAVSVTLSEDEQVATINDDIQVITLLGNEQDGWYLYTNATDDYPNGGYLYSPGSQKRNQLWTSEEIVDGALATISIATDTKATVAFQVPKENDYTGEMEIEPWYIRYNKSNDGMFSCYDGPSNQLDIWLYTRGEVTPTVPEVTLAWLCQNGVETKSYKISNDLQVAYVDVESNVLWVKDADGQSIWSTSPAADDDNFQIEVQGNTHDEQGEYDQSNWLEVHLTGNNAISFKDKVIKGGSIRGKFTSKLNPTMADVTLTTEDINTESTLTAYAPNYYMAANFFGSQNCGSSMAGEDGHGHFFFMNPKPQEFAHVVWAFYSGNNTMTMPTEHNTHEFQGTFKIDMSMNEGLSELVEGTGYNDFQAIIRLKKTTSTMLKDSKPEGTEYIVYPLNITSQTPTAINGVIVNGEVKSVKYVNVAGMVSDVPFQGVNIVVTEYSDGSRSTSKMLRK